MRKKEYVEFSRVEFERKLVGIQYLLGWNEFKDVTSDLEVEGKTIFERVYEVEFAGKYIRIYSSIDVRTDRTRESGNDKVKVVSILREDGKEKYCNLGKHVRIHTLFDNIKKTFDKVSEGRIKENYVESLVEVLM
jgi:hypothetical protein